MNTKRLAAFSLCLACLFSLSGTEKGYSKITDSHIGITRTVSAQEAKTVIPGGNCIGVSLCADGALVVSTADVTSADGSFSSPAADAGIKPGDLIQKFNNEKINGVEDLEKAIKNAKGKSSTVKIKRQAKEMDILVKPKISGKDNSFRIGAWVKDAASGIGTMTFYDPKTKTFAALGHGICDPETGNILSIGNGDILDATIVSVDKGEKGVPGELNGIFSESNSAIGKITHNCELGIFGQLNSSFIIDTSPLPIANRDEIKTGPAYIRANTEGSKVEQFSIEITKILPKSISSQKNMIIKITDEKLLNKTGGIVQGMSGSPVIQNGKLVGAVTHVFVNDPTRGYGIFIENMLGETEKIKQ